jgi:LPXTG-site transpeptidase (sortase) family protein
MVVGPEDVWVLHQTDRPMLTLITCYPFAYVGKAPRRFIVRAERTGIMAAKDLTLTRLED